jgi:hypothetical protein
VTDRLALILLAVTVVASFLEGSATMRTRARCESIAGPTATEAHVQGDWCLWRDDAGAWRYRRMSAAGPQDKLAATGTATE